MRKTVVIACQLTHKMNVEIIPFPGWLFNSFRRLDVCGSYDKKFKHNKKIAELFYEND